MSGALLVQPARAAVRQGLLALAAWVASVPLLTPAFSQQPAVAQASANPLTFVYRRSQPGDQAVQSLSLRLKLETTIRMAGQIAGQSGQELDRNLQYHVAMLDAAPGETARAKLVYLSAEERRHEDPRAPVQPPRAMPVAGKTYLVVRSSARLEVLDSRGAQPPDEERAVVERTMRALGQANPLSKFLDRKTIAVGERVVVPAEIAREIWDFGPEFGIVDRCELTLIEPTAVEGRACGRFAAMIATTPTSTGPAAGNSSAGIRLEGELLVEVESCQLLGSRFQGQVGSEEERGPAGFRYTVRRGGQLQMASQATRVLR